MSEAGAARRRMPVRWGFLAVAALSVGGCGVDRLSEKVAGGSSMRVEVEVYKGPLSKEVEIQWTELAALVREASQSFSVFNDAVVVVAANKGYLEQTDPFLAAAESTAAWLNEHERRYLKTREHLVGVQGLLKTADQNAKDDKRKELWVQNPTAPGNCHKVFKGNPDPVAARRDCARVLVDELDEMWAALKVLGRIVAEKNPESKNVELAIQRATSRIKEIGENLGAFADAVKAVNSTSVDEARCGDLADPPLFTWFASRDENKARDAAHCAGSVAGKADSEFKNLEQAANAQGVRDVLKAVEIRARRTAAGPLTIVPHYRRTFERGKGPTDLDTRIVAAVGGRDVRSQEATFIWCGGREMDALLRSSLWDFSDYAHCATLAMVHDDASRLIDLIHDVEKKFTTVVGRIKPLSGVLDPDPDNPDLVTLIQIISEIGARFKVKAIFWGEKEMVYGSRDRLVRHFVTQFSNLSAEYGNQLMSRSDALMQQCRLGGEIRGPGQSCKGIERQRLPLSVYLREINPTEFLNLFTYNRAATLPLWEEAVTRPFWALGSEETTDRIRVIERLFADHNWAKINQVHANGQGDVRMAFIKDDIGNWNLKTFAADPSELAKAYTDLTKAAVAAAVTAATSGGASAALDLASRFARGKVGSGSAQAGGVDLAALRKSFERQMETIKANQLKAEEAATKACRLPVAPPVAPPVAEGPHCNPKQNDNMNQELKVALTQARQKAAKDTRDLLVHYGAILEDLERAVAASSEPAK